MGEVNYINYPVVQGAQKDYQKYAGDIEDLISAIQRTNSDLQGGWSNETARAFAQRINTDHIPKLRDAAEAIQEVSNYINNYLRGKQDEDTQGAHAISG